jgi:hypothetical protein
VRGKRRAELETFYAYQEDAWERHSRIMAKLHEQTVIVSTRISGGEIRDNAFKEDDHYNDWLRMPGVAMPDDERHALEQEVIAEQKVKKAAALEALAKKQAEPNGGESK